MRVIHATDRPFVPASHENPLAPGVWKKVLAQKAELMPGTVQMVNWARMNPGNHFAAHYHEDMQELFIILQGAARITVDRQTAVLNRGDAVLIDPREVHEMSSEGDQELEYLALGIATGTGGRTVVV
jgi:mannose-6-phosphate isomerase-like protein (cupin superfamily)